MLFSSIIFTCWLLSAHYYITDATSLDICKCQNSSGFFLGGEVGGGTEGRPGFQTIKGGMKCSWKMQIGEQKKTKNAFGDAAGVDSSSIHMSLGVQIISEEKKSSCKMGST